MAGYNPANGLNWEPKKNWFQRWRERRRHKKAERKRAWMVMMAGICTPDAQKEEMYRFLNNMSDYDILCPIGQESWRH